MSRKLTWVDHTLFVVIIATICILMAGCAYAVLKETCPSARTKYERMAWAYRECREDPGCMTTIDDIQAVDLARSRVQAACSAPVPVDKSQE